MLPHSNEALGTIGKKIFKTCSIISMTQFGRFLTVAEMPLQFRLTIKNLSLSSNFQQPKKEVRDAAQKTIHKCSYHTGSTNLQISNSMMLFALDQGPIFQHPTWDVRSYTSKEVSWASLLSNFTDTDSHLFSGLFACLI